MSKVIIKMIVELKELLMKNCASWKISEVDNKGPQDFFTFSFQEEVVANGLHHYLNN